MLARKRVKAVKFYSNKAVFVINRLCFLLLLDMGNDVYCPNEEAMSEASETFYTFNCQNYGGDNLQQIAVGSFII